MSSKDEWTIEQWVINGQAKELAKISDLVSSLFLVSQQLIAYFREWLRLESDCYTHKKL